MKFDIKIIKSFCVLQKGNLHTNSIRIADSFTVAIKFVKIWLKMLRIITIMKPFPTQSINHGWTIWQKVLKSVEVVLFWNTFWSISLDFIAFSDIFSIKEKTHTKLFWFDRFCNKFLPIGISHLLLAKLEGILSKIELKHQDALKI